MTETLHTVVLKKSHTFSADEVPSLSLRLAPAVLIFRQVGALQGLAHPLHHFVFEDTYHASNSASHCLSFNPSVILPRLQHSDLMEGPSLS